ncbi:hypothetical protein ABZ832_07230 [Streptantibioticus parmotrematis]|uniref:hypothetical protein n=1 Tax=Streptantibioticus parmotrematis TaxID=2873249 RepID=UPI0033C87DD4
MHTTVVALSGTAALALMSAVGARTASTHGATPARRPPAKPRRAVLRAPRSR